MVKGSHLKSNIVHPCDTKNTEFDFWSFNRLLKASFVALTLILSIKLAIKLVDYIMSRRGDNGEGDIPGDDEIPIQEEHMISLVVNPGEKELNSVIGALQQMAEPKSANDVRKATLDNYTQDSTYGLNTTLQDDVKNTSVEDCDQESAGGDSEEEDEDVEAFDDEGEESPISKYDWSLVESELPLSESAGPTSQELNLMQKISHLSDPPILDDHLNGNHFDDQQHKKIKVNPPPSLKNVEDSGELNLPLWASEDPKSLQDTQDKITMMCYGEDNNALKNLSEEAMIRGNTHLLLITMKNIIVKQSLMIQTLVEESKRNSASIAGLESKLDYVLKDSKFTKTYQNRSFQKRPNVGDIPHKNIDSEQSSAKYPRRTQHFKQRNDQGDKPPGKQVFQRKKTASQTHIVVSPSDVSQIQDNNQLDEIHQVVNEYNNDQKIKSDKQKVTGNEEDTSLNSELIKIIKANNPSSRNRVVKTYLNKKNIALDDNDKPKLEKLLSRIGKGTNDSVLQLIVSEIVSLFH